MGKSKAGKITMWVFFCLLIIGGLNWGVLGISGFFGKPFNFVEVVFRIDWLINTVYTLVGISALSGLIGKLTKIF